MDWDSSLQQYQSAATNNTLQVVIQIVPEVIGLDFNPEFLWLQKSPVLFASE